MTFPSDSPLLPTAREEPLADLCARVTEALAKTTPGPWVVREHPADASKFFVQAQRLDPKHPYDIEILGEDDTLYPTRRADAALIVLLVNSAARLVEGVQSLHDTAAMTYGQLQQSRETVTALRATLAEAERERDGLREALRPVLTEFEAIEAVADSSILRQRGDPLYIERLIEATLRRRRDRAGENTNASERERMRTALEQLADIQLSDDTCASVEVATRRVRAIARAALSSSPGAQQEGT